MGAIRGHAGPGLDISNSNTYSKDGTGSRITQRHWFIKTLSDLLPSSPKALLSHFFNDATKMVRAGSRLCQ